MNRYFTRNVTKCKGFKVTDNGEVQDFEGDITNCGYMSLSRASIAARKYYKDPTITVTEVSIERHKYMYDDAELMKIATKIN